MTWSRRVAVALAWTVLGAAFVPSDAHLSITDRAITVDSAGRVLSTATLCPGFAFDAIGNGGPHFSPDLHWVLVDIRGPFTPGNVPRNHALVDVATGGIATSGMFATYLGVPSTLRPLGWVSGERATLRYADGTTHAVHDPPLRPMPAAPCTSATTAATLPSAAP